MKKTVRKLHLHRETLHSLNARETRKVGAGATPITTSRLVGVCSCEPESCAATCSICPETCVR